VPLVVTGLVCHYYFDEAASGTDPTSAADARGNCYNLTDMDYDISNIAWNEISGSRALDSLEKTGDQYVRRLIKDSSDAL